MSKKQVVVLCGVMISGVGGVLIGMGYDIAGFVFAGAGTVVALIASDGERS